MDWNISKAQTELIINTTKIYSYNMANLKVMSTYIVSTFQASKSEIVKTLLVDIKFRSLQQTIFEIYRDAFYEVIFVN